MYEVVDNQPELVYREVGPHVTLATTQNSSGIHLPENIPVHRTREPASHQKMLHAQNTSLGTFQWPGNNKSRTLQSYSAPPQQIVSVSNGNLEQNFSGVAIPSSSAPPLQNCTSSDQLQTDPSNKSGGSKPSRKSSSKPNKTSKPPNPNYKVPPGRKRARITPEIRKMFQNIFVEIPRPDRMERERLADLSGLYERQVQIWFQNARKTKKGEELALKLKNDCQTAP